MIKIKKKRIVIDSSILNIDKNINSKTDMVYNFDKQIKNIKSIKLVSLSFPANYNNISELRNNNKLKFREFIFNSHIYDIRFLKKSDRNELQTNELDSIIEPKQLIITVEKWHRAFYNIDSNLDKISREPLNPSNPNKNKSLFSTDKELINFYDTYSDFTRFSETHRIYKWSFNDYLKKNEDYGIVWNSVYHINDEDLEKLTNFFTNKFKEYWDPNTNSYFSKFILTHNTISADGLKKLFIRKLPKLYQDAKGDRLSNTLISIYRDHTITIPNGNYSTDLLLNQLHLQFQLKQKKFNKNFDNYFDNTKHNTDGILNKWRGKDDKNLNIRKKYILDYLSCWNEKRSWFVKLYEEDNISSIHSTYRGILQDKITKKINFIFNVPYRNLTTSWDEDINYALPWYEKLFCLVKSGGDIDYDLLYYLGFTKFNKPLVKNIKNNLREDFAYFPQFIDIEDKIKDYLQVGNSYGTYDVYFNRNKTLNLSKNPKIYELKTFKNNNSVVTNFKTYLNKNGDRGITIPSDITLPNTLSDSSLLHKEYLKFPNFWKATPFSVPNDNISKKYMMVQSNNNSNLSSDNYIFMTLNDYSVYNSLIDKKFQIPLSSSPYFIYHNTEKILNTPIFYKFMTKTYSNNDVITIANQNGLQKITFPRLKSLNKLNIRFFDRFNKNIDIGGGNYTLIFEFEIYEQSQNEKQ